MQRDRRTVTRIAGNVLARYTYVFNNPLTGTDPSGFFSLGWLDPFGGQARGAYKALGDFARNPFDNFNLYALERSMPGRATMDNFVFSHSWAEAIGHAALGVVSLFCTGAAPACMTAMEMHVAGYKTWAMGGDRDDVLGAMIEAGATTVISAAGNQAIGGIANGYANVAAHAVFGCATATMGGGKCGAGATSRAITAGADRIDTGNFWSRRRVRKAHADSNVAVNQSTIVVCDGHFTNAAPRAACCLLPGNACLKNRMDSSSPADVSSA